MSIASTVKTVAVAAVFGSMLAHASSAWAVTIAYSGYPGSISAFWASVTDAVKAEAAKEGVTLLDLTTPEADAAAQKNAIDTAISQGVDGLIIGAVDNRGFDDTLNQAQEKGIPVVAVDTGIDHPAGGGMRGADSRSLLKASLLRPLRVSPHAVVTQQGDHA